MARTQCVIIYSHYQALRRRVIIPDDDTQISAHTGNLANGEIAIVVALADYAYWGPDALVARHSGRPAQAGNCVIVGAHGLPVNIVMADPQIDTHPLGRIALDRRGQGFHLLGYGQ